ncbi:hypothetical protein ACFQZZ_28775 [Nocardia sp. GCM10030253]|uniref:hypothetical protein n=1 Tax=Nocardia sp. GCM10030253 TaxID=3273404 RepID=UPI00362A864C
MSKTVSNSTKTRDDPDEPRRRIVGRIATVASTATIVALGPGLAVAQAAISKNHNEVMATGG